MTYAVVTGGAGFVGSRLVHGLLARGVDQILVIDRLSDYYPAWIKRNNLERLTDDRVNFLEADLSSVELEDSFEGADVVFHQAGQPGVRPSWGKSFDTYVRDNIVATQRILEAAVAVSSRPKVVYASSSSIYGEAKVFPVTEQSLPRPVSPYGVTKLAAEHLVSLYAATRGLDSVSLRYFTVYGPGQRPDMAFTRLCRSAITGEEFSVFGTGEQVRDFTYVDDVVSANILAWTRSTEPGSWINIAGGSSMSLNDCIDIVQGLTDSRLNISRGETALGDVTRTGAATDKARDILGWRPQVTVEAGLAAQFEWAASQFGTDPS